MGTATRRGSAGRASGPATTWRAWAAGQLGGDRAYRPWPTIAGAFILSALSFLWLPDSLGYDPWSWLVWGRELAHLHLSTSGAASSIKPLPIIVTGLFGWTSKDPTIWLVVARAGAIMAVLAAYQLGSRLAGRLAGLIAAVGLLTAYQYLPYLTIAGMSEPSSAALALFAVQAHLDRRRWSALVMLLLAGLIRIELWLFLAAYGLWWIFGPDQPRPAAPPDTATAAAAPAAAATKAAATKAARSDNPSRAQRFLDWALGGPYPLIHLGAGRHWWSAERWTDPSATGLSRLNRRQWSTLGVIGLLLLLPICWFLPDVIGSGDVLRSAQRATHESQGGPLLSRYPGLATFKESRKMVVGSIGGAFAGAVAAGLYFLARRRQHPGPVPLAFWLALAAVAWLTLEAFMAQFHLATGAPRYLLPGVGLACVVAGWAWVETARLAARPFRNRSRRMGAVGVVLVALVGWSTQGLWGFIPQVRLAVRTENGVLVSEMPAAIARLGGRQRILACGPISAAPLQNPTVAWGLDIPLGAVNDLPGRRGTLFATAGLPTIPAKYQSRYHLVAHVGTTKAPWNLWTTCNLP